MGNEPGDGAEIVPLWQRRMGLIYPQVEDLKAYWCECRAGAALPRRAALDPRAFPGALAASFIAERVRPGVVRFRLAGSHLAALMGMEVRGMPVRALFDLPDRPRLMELVDAVFATPAILDAAIAADSCARTPLPGRLVMLPLRDADDAVTRALGCLVTDGAIGAPPCRFRLRATHLDPIGPADATGMRPASGDAAAVRHRSGPRVSRPGAPSGLSEPPAPAFAGPALKGDGRPVLTLVHGGKGD